MDDPRFGGRTDSDRVSGTAADDQLEAAATTQGPLPAAVAARLIERGRERLDLGEAVLAATDFRRVIGHEDPSINGAAWLGLGDALYRLDAEADAADAWASATRLRDSAATYDAWRRLAGVRVRSGDLPGAVEAYREAERRAPPEDRPEIAARLGWLAKETGNAGAASRYFARARGGTVWGLSHLIIIVTAVISFAALADEGLVRLLWLERGEIQSGELYRLLSVTLVHGSLIHLAFNMYALWILGPIVEMAWGRWLFMAFYILTALVASTASFLFSGLPSVGASGAVFGLVGVLIAGTRAHHPMLDRRARAIIPQLGFLVVINLVFGFAVGGMIDNSAHIGGLLAGLWLGFLVPPGKVPTLRSAWQHPRGGQPAERSPLLVAAGLIGLLGVIILGLAVGGATL
ncbi:MAG TPA: rhomboid family intramembrane serine protease [Candidatus Deferrimicrobiaceae bacterium]|nr:rhomboid family intramembrane serine protease [Candidatus Deferrimicrobiaceae bacterium]